MSVNELDEYFTLVKHMVNYEKEKMEEARERAKQRQGNRGYTAPRRPSRRR